jgi:hypothetical protein
LEHPQGHVLCHVHRLRPHSLADGVHFGIDLTLHFVPDFGQKFAVQVLLVQGHILTDVQTVRLCLGFVMVRRRHEVVGKEYGVNLLPLLPLRGFRGGLLSSAELFLFCFVKAIRDTGFLEAARSRSALVCLV